MSRGKSAAIGSAFIVAVGILGLIILRDAGGPWLQYGKDGGFQGLALKVVVEEDGSATLTEELPEPKTSKFMLDEQTMERLEAAVDDVAWADLAGDHTTAGADLLLVTFMHDGHTIRTNLTDRKEDALLAVVGILDAEIARVRSSD